jgi:hypothetical protein
MRRYDVVYEKPAEEKEIDKIYEEFRGRRKGSRRPRRPVRIERSWSLRGLQAAKGEEKAKAGPRRP